jgi:transmembrane 9 superfamily protein 2/4
MGLTSNKPKNVKTEDVAWKKLQGDVFRKPDFAVLLVTMCGMGI